MGRRRLVGWLVVWLAILAPAGAAAADRCEEELSQAEANYTIGRFEEALQQVDACLAKGPSRGDRIAALALAAKVHVVLDDLEAARQRVTALLAVDPTYTANARRDPPLFVHLVAQGKQGSADVQVSSVSKTAESLREAPATVTVVTAEEIERRGYLDLEAVLHDLPGFDISRSNGITYSTAFLRGYRSDNADRTLFLIDGVEENDVWSNIAYISRQFSLSNVSRVEVVYGPASTLYGANAYLGVINVLTKDPSELIEEGKKLGTNIHVAAGSFGTTYVDATVAGRSGVVSWSLTGRVFHSDEQDLARFGDWDFDPAFYDSVDYGGLLGISGASGAQGFRDFLAESGLTDCTGQTGCLYRLGATGVQLTPAGKASAVALDQSLITDPAVLLRATGERVPLGEPLTFSDPTDDWLLSGKLKLPSLEMGFRTWTRDEGSTPFYTDRSAVGAGNGHFWIPRQTSLYLKYDRKLKPTLLFNAFVRYKRHDVDDRSVLQFSSSYFRGQLDLEDLVLETAPSLSRTFFHLTNNQLRAEFSLVYTPTTKLSVVSGLELRDSSLQGAYVKSELPNPSAIGEPDPDFPGDNTFRNRDLGLYAQASYKATEKLKLVLGGRLDNNEISNGDGYGTVFNPRLAVVYLPKDGSWVLKAIYSEAFKDASNFQKYATITGQRDQANLGLEPEQVKNVELSTGWQVWEDLSFDVALYDARYSQVVELGVTPDGSTTQFQNTGALRIQGLQANAALDLGEWTLWGNYTWADPRNTEPKGSDGLPLGGERPIGDIAEHQVNLGVGARLRDRFDLNLRLNWVGTKNTGRDTTVEANPFEEIDAYLVAHASLTYEGILPGTSLQLVVHNLFDEEYYHPGPRSADGDVLTARSPQPERSVYLRLLYSF